MLDKTLEYYKMAEAEDHLWWYRALHLQTLLAIQKHFGKENKSIRILDAGCGTGGMMKYLIENGYQNLLGVELSDTGYQFCVERKLPVIHQDLSEFRSSHPDLSFDLIISHDVFCYLSDEDNVKILTDFEHMLSEGGLILMNLPALNAFKGMHDIGVGLLRRYHKTELKLLVSNTTLKIKHINYWPQLLSPFILAARLLQRVKMKINPSSPVVSDVNVPPKFVNRLLFLLTSFELKLRFVNLMGSSMFVRLTK
jgi:SAM-dependent methyltransferase